MAENKQDINNNPDPKGEGAPKGGTPAEGQKPDKTPTSDGGINLTDEQLEAAFKHPRFKDLTEKNQKYKQELEKLKKDRDEAEKKTLEEQNKYKELYERENQKLVELQDRIATYNREQAITQEAVKAGIKDVEAAIKLTDMSKLVVDSDGKVTNAAEVIEGLVEVRPYLVTETPPANIGSDGGSNSQAAKKGKIWGLTELRGKMRDTEWYSDKENKAEVDAAWAEGRVDRNR